MSKSKAPVPGSMDEVFNLVGFTKSLIGDLNLLRAGKISVSDARARADLAKQTLRAVGYIIQARKFVEGQARQIEGTTRG